MQERKAKALCREEVTEEWLSSARYPQPIRPREGARTATPTTVLGGGGGVVAVGAGAGVIPPRATAALLGAA
jgi:hypothetical protein